LAADEDEDEFDDDDDLEKEDSPGVEMDCRIQMDENNVYIMEQDRAVAHYLLGRVPDEFRHTPKPPAKKATRPKKKKSE
jgi:hypothetical protein